MNRLTNGWTEFLEIYIYFWNSFSKALAVMCKDLKQGSSGASGVPLSLDPHSQNGPLGGPYLV
jgi:hypothetical protein